MRKTSEIIEEEIAKVPRKLLEALVVKKLEEAGASNPNDIAPSLLDHTLSGAKTKFIWDDGEPGSHRNISISITDEDIRDFQNKLDKFFGSLPEIIKDAADDVSKELLRKLKRRWRDEHAAQLQEFSFFRENIEFRWGTALDLLRMLLTISREIGEERLKRTRRNKPSHTREALFRLHARACQITAEIIVLLENGFADGAIARWRTLHEVCMVSIVLSDNGEEIAERYLAHEVVETKRAMEEYKKSSLAAGFNPLPQREINKIDRAYEKALKKYGKEFSSPYGWAAHHLRHNKPTFADIEAEAGSATMRPFYKFASYNVHASAKGIFFKLGLLDSFDIIAGASNAGLADPGQNAAFTLATITNLLFGPKSKFEDVVTMQVLANLREEITKEFWRADRKLGRDHKRQLDEKKTKVRRSK